MTKNECFENWILRRLSMMKTGNGDSFASFYHFLKTRIWKKFWKLILYRLIDLADTFARSHVSRLNAKSVSQCSCGRHRLKSSCDYMIPIPSFFLFAYLARRSGVAFYIFHHVASKRKELTGVFFLSIITSSKIYEISENNLKHFCSSKNHFSVRCNRENVTRTFRGKRAKFQKNG